MPMVFVSKKNYKKFEHTHGISRSVKNQKLEKYQSTFLIHQHVWAKMEPKEIARMIL